MAEKYIGISCERFTIDTSEVLLKTILYGLQQLNDNQMLLLITCQLDHKNEILVVERVYDPQKLNHTVYHK